MKKIIVLTIILIALYVLKGTAFSYTYSTDGLVSYWSFNDHSDPVVDNFNGNDGTNSGASWISNGANGGAMSFDGVNNYIDIGNNSSVNISGDLTLSAWVNLDYLPSSSVALIGKMGPNSGLPKDDQYLLHINDTGFGFLAYNTELGGGINAPYENFEANQWIHIAGTYEASTYTYRLYANGELLMEDVQDISPYAPYTTSINLSLGATPDDQNPRYLPGGLDEVFIYNRALSAPEIEQLYTMVPEPISSILFISGGTLLAGRRYWKKRKLFNGGHNE